MTQIRPLWALACTLMFSGSLAWSQGTSLIPIQAAPVLHPIAWTGAMLDVGCTDPSCTDPGCAMSAACDAPSCGGGGACSSCGLEGCGLGTCNLGEPFALSDRLFPCAEKLTIGGWVQAGYHSESNDLFNSIPDRVNLHQSWLYVERVAEADACQADWGFRADVMYGIDADDTQAFGNPPGSWDYLNGWDRGSGYGWALPQLYGEVAFGDWSVKAGHFFTLVGYEVVTAPDNFFYSHSMTMYNSEPFTHTGVLATRTINEYLTAFGGWTLGWDTGFDQFGQGSSFLGGLSATLTDAITLTYIATAGDFGARGDDAYSHSVVIDVAVSEKVNYVFQSDLVRVRETGEDNVGINQFFFYTINDCLSVGTRSEWWKADGVTGYAPHAAVLPANGSFSYYAYTVGANVRPHANLVFRPEVRFDWSPGLDYEETIFGIDGIVTF